MEGKGGGHSAEICHISDADATSAVLMSCQRLGYMESMPGQRWGWCLDAMMSDGGRAMMTMTMTIGDVSMARYGFQGLHRPPPGQEVVWVSGRAYEV